MTPTLSIEEEELAKTLKRQGKSTQEIMGEIARSRTSKVVAPRQEATQPRSLAQRVLQDVPSDFVEIGQGVIDTIQRGGQDIRTSWQQPGLTVPQRVVGTQAALGKTVLDVAGEGIVGYGKMLTSDELEKAVVQKFGETGQAVANTSGAQKLASWYNRQDDNTKFMLSKVFAPLGEVAFEAATAGVGTGVAKTTGQTVGNMAESATKNVTDTLQDVMQTSGVVRPQVGTVRAPLPPDVKSNIVTAFDVAIKPNLTSKQTPAQRSRFESQVSQAVESIVNNVDNLKFVDEATGETVTGKLPENLKEMVDALEQTKQTIFAQYDDIATKAGELGAQIDTIRVANSLDEVINSKSLKLSNPEAVSYAQGVRDRLIQTKNLSASDAQDVIRNYNNSLDAFYRNPTPEGLTRSSVDALVANQMRVSLDKNIEGLTGAQYQSLKNEYAALKAVERDVMRAFNRDARRNAKGLIDFTDVLTGGQVVSGILSMNPAALAQGFAGKAIATGIKMVNDPNRKVRQMFQEAGKYRRPEQPFTGSTRRQLPPARSDVRSEVGSGAPITATQAGASAPRGQVVESTRPGAIRRSDSEPTPTMTETALKIDDMAVQQAIMEMEIQVNERPRGSNLAYNTEGETYRFKMLPTWIPKDLRDGDLLDRVMRNISEGKKPRSNATNEQQLQEVMEERIKARIEEIKKTEPKAETSGVFSNDAAFAAALMAGGTYYFMSEDGEMMPIVAVGSILANPKAAKLALKSLTDQRAMMQKSIKTMEENGQTKTTKYKQLVKAHDQLVGEIIKYQKASAQ